MLKNLSSKIVAVTSLFALIGIILGAWFFIDDYIDRKMAKLEKSVVGTINHLKIKMIRDELNAITTREHLGIATKYDKIRKRELELEWFGKNNVSIR